MGALKAFLCYVMKVVNGGGWPVALYSALLEESELFYGL